MTIFSLAWHQDHSEATAYERPAGSALTHLAVSSPTNAETVAAVAQASTYAPWSGMRRCNLWDDGSVTAYYGDRCYTDTDVDNMGQSMVQIPKFWYTTDHTAPDYTWYISDTGAAATEPAGHDHDWHIHPAFCRMSTLLDNAESHNGTGETALKVIDSTGYVAGDTVFIKDSAGCETRTIGTVTGATDIELTAGLTNTYTEANGAVISRVKDYLYVSAYEGFFNTVTSKLESKSGQAVTTYKTMPQFKTAARLRAGVVNNRWEPLDFLTASAIQLLNLVEYGTFNSRGVLGGGITVDTAAHLTGETAIGGAHASGNATYGTGGATTVMSYRGIENFFGNITTFLDGINLKADYTVWIADHDFAVDTYAHPYTNDAGLAIAQAASFSKDITVTATTDYAFLSSLAVGGSPYTYLCDWWTAVAVNSLGALAGRFDLAGGMFGFYNTYNATTNTSRCGARLMYIG